MHPGVTGRKQRKHESRAVPQLSLVATSKGLEQGTAPVVTTHVNTGREPLNPVRPPPQPVPKTTRTIGTRIGDPHPTSVASAVGARTDVTAGSSAARPLDVALSQYSDPHRIADAPQPPAQQPPQPPAQRAAMTTRSGSVVPSYTSHSLPLISAKKGVPAPARRLHAHSTAEEWIDGIVSKYGGLVGPPPEAFLNTPPPPVHSSAPSIAVRRHSGSSSESQTAPTGALVPSSRELVVVDGSESQHGVLSVADRRDSTDQRSIAETDAHRRKPSVNFVTNSETAVTVYGGYNAPALDRHSSGTAYTTVQGAQVRKQLYALCQQLIIDANRAQRRGNTPSATTPKGTAPVIEVEVREHGRTVWHSAYCSEADLDETELAVEAADEDVAAVRKRAHRAFHKTVKVYKDKIDAQRVENERLRAEAASKDADGSLYREAIGQIEGLKHANRQLNAKIKALMKLLERAGATIKHQEEQHEEQAAIVASGAGRGAVALDWESVRAVVPDLIVEDREGPGILRDVVDYLDRMNLRVAELEASNETFSEKFADKDAQCDVYRRERDSLSVRARLSDSTIESLRAEVNAVAAALDAALKDKEDAKKQFEADRDKLILQTMEAEKAIRKTVEVKPFFIGQGKGLAVPVLLRFEGRVRNLDMPKKEVEDLVNLIWAARDAQNAVKRAQKAIEFRDKQARGEIKDSEQASLQGISAAATASNNLSTTTTSAS
jgi:hypothetical protein